MFLRRCLLLITVKKWLENQNCGENASFVNLTVVGGRLKQKKLYIQESKVYVQILQRIK
jgi:hypothetical protein